MCKRGRGSQQKLQERAEPRSSTQNRVRQPAQDRSGFFPHTMPKEGRASERREQSGEGGGDWEGAIPGPCGCSVLTRVWCVCLLIRNRAPEALMHVVWVCCCWSGPQTRYLHTAPPFLNDSFHFLGLFRPPRGRPAHCMRLWLLSLRKRGKSLCVRQFQALAPVPGRSMAPNACLCMDGMRSGGLTSLVQEV